MTRFALGWLPSRAENLWSVVSCAATPEPAPPTSNNADEAINISAQGRNRREGEAQTRVTKTIGAIGLVKLVKGIRFYPCVRTYYVVISACPEDPCAHQWEEAGIAP